MRQLTLHMYLRTGIKEAMVFMHFLLDQTSHEAFCKYYLLNVTAGWQGGLRVATL